ncbi:hypothetical protein [Sediminibacillus halophilus]|uniref:Uncharacterized protein n=1 Tax=Sediminibacillus halophilus TaxID=482461 RepID=A0A1G9X2U4_9BACI|nr:hypothetical protein [Sediminibacillus halophilus]SDM91017.1 hypothetical protein SAMN05216244_3727 [Sediminibacillus halophilus]
MAGYEEFKEKLTAWNQQTAAYLNQIGQLIEEKQNRTLPLPRLTGYFTSSLHAAHHKKRENILFGDFHIKNTGSQPVRDLSICLRIRTTVPYDFSGKYHLPNSNASSRKLSEWERVEQESEEDYWFKRMGEGELLPGETVTFSNFQLKWKADDHYTMVVEGFVYCNLDTDGINALNQLNISGEI